MHRFAWSVCSVAALGASFACSSAESQPPAAVAGASPAGAGAGGSPITSAGAGGASAGSSAVAGAPSAGSGGTGGAVDDEPIFDASKLTLKGTPGAPLCVLSADMRKLLVPVENQGTTPTGRAIVEATSQYGFKVQVKTPPLEPGKSATLEFDRGALGGYSMDWTFSFVLDPAGRHGPPHAALPGACSALLRDRTGAGMEPLAARFDAPSGLWDKNAWWTGANMLETSIDYMREAGDMTYAALIDTSFEKNKAGDFLKKEWNPRYFDDEGWWALTWIKAYDLTHQQKYLDMAKTIFQDLTGAWDTTCGGGVWWNSDRKYKNAITNELFFTIAVRLHQRTAGDTTYLDWANKEWAWFKASGMIKADHLIMDGLKVCGANNQNTFETPVYTYNQGVILGALVDLAQAKGDATLLDTADQIAQAAMQKKVTPDGIVSEGCEFGGGCGDGDGEIFKGVFARNLAYLHTARPKPEYRAFLIAQSNSIWNKSRGEDNAFGLLWQGPFDKLTSSRQSSALDALIAAISAANPNLSLRATATGSASCSAAETVSNVLDGSSRWNSKWCSAGDSGQELTVDLGAPREIVNFVVQHAEAGGEKKDWNTRDFEIAVSSDGQTWTEKARVTDNNSGATVHHIASVTARYVRLHVSKSQWDTELPAARIYELEVHGTDP